MLEEIMREVEKARGPLTVRELARRVGVEESALEGMLGFLERKGRLSVYRPDEGCEECSVISCPDCVFRASCPAAGHGRKGDA